MSFQQQLVADAHALFKNHLSRRCAPILENMSANLVISSAADVSSVVNHRSGEVSFSNDQQICVGGAWDGILAAIAFPMFIFLLPLLMFLPLMPGMPADEAWLLRVCFPFLSPFSAVLWFIVLHR